MTPPNRESGQSVDSHQCTTNTPDSAAGCTHDHNSYSVAACGSLASTLIV
eukprot:m.3955 g.3955  ORF g.3955 m.3955 type:complete len:50 (+) comp2759_c0_seq1:104-253(+)